MIDIKEIKDCCGCTACVSVCGHNCITMVEDSEGFKYPKVDVAKCVGCGLCEKVCPMLHPESDKDVLKVVGVKHKDDSVRMASSSGGAFSIIAEAVIDKGGVVVGCAMDDCLQAVHVVCYTKSELSRLRSSKYVQSDIEGIFPLVRKILREGKIVLFSGTPCQVAGLRKFLIKSYDNLYCIDVLCHGVPSPKLFREYKMYLEQRYVSKANFVSFRCKKKEWKRLFIDFKFENGKEYFKSASFDPYMQLFLGNRSQRKSCFYCPFTTTHRQGDISLGDFWGIGCYYPKLDDNKGISMVLINSEKGNKLYSIIKEHIVSIDSSLNQAIAGNKVLIENIQGEFARDQFYADFVAGGLQVSLVKHARYYPMWKQYYINIMRRGLDFIRKILHKRY